MDGWQESLLQSQQRPVDSLACSVLMVFYVEDMQMVGLRVLYVVVVDIILMVRLTSEG